MRKITTRRSLFCALLLASSGLLGQQAPPFSSIDPFQFKKNPPGHSNRPWSIPGDENWMDQFAWPGTHGEVHAIAMHNDTVYVGGAFTEASGTVVNHIAKWDGTRWSALGGGVNGEVYSIFVHANEIYVGGSFTKVGSINANHLAKWNGTQWSAIDNGLDYPVRAIAMKDNVLYVGGQFIKAGSLTVNRIAKWDGKEWSSLGTGLNDAVNVMTVSGDYLYVGGAFTTAGGKEVNYIARWAGTRWESLGSGVFSYPYSGRFYGGVHAIAVRGNEVFVGGFISGAGASSAVGIARWDGIEWHQVGGNIDGQVWSIVIEGNDLYAAGFFDSAGGKPASGVAKWDGTSWSALGSGLLGAPKYVFAAAIHNGKLYVGGDFQKAGAFIVNKIARWDGQSWSGLGNGIIGLDNFVRAVACNDSGTFVGGDFSTVNQLVVNYVARWNGIKWSNLGSGVNSVANALAAHGSDVYVGGAFTEAGGIPANYIAKWNGREWSALGSGVNNIVDAIAVSETEVYAGGRFTEAGGATVNHIAKWDGRRWSGLGSGVNGTVNVIAVHGTDIYVGGAFTQAGSQTVNYVAKWDGRAWSALGAGVNAEVAAIAIRDDEVFVGGLFTQAGGQPTQYVAKWDGTRWFDLDSRMDFAVLTLAVNAGILYAGGGFTQAGGVVAHRMAKWHGTRWSALGSGLFGGPFASVANDHDLFVVGAFDKAGGKGAWNFARWHESNLAPLARSDKATIREEESVTINVLANDSDLDGEIDPQTLVVARPPEHGRVEKNADHSLTYFPNKDFSGREVFEYIVNDLQGLPSNLGAVRIDVTNINDAPILDNSGDMRLTTVTKGEMNPSGDAVADIIASAGGDRITDVDSGAVEGIAVIGADNTNGTWQYAKEPNAAWANLSLVSDTAAVLLNTQARLRFVPKPDFSGFSGSLTFRAWDQTVGANGDSNVDVSTNGDTTAFSANAETATVKVNVKPTAFADSTTTNEDTNVILAVTTNDTDADGTIDKGSVVIMAKPAHGEIKFNDDATLLYIPEPNFNGRDSFTYTVNDNDGALSNAANVSIVIKPVNDAPGPFARRSPFDNISTRADSLLFQWTRARDVDGDEVNYSFKLRIQSIDTTIATADTLLRINFHRLKLKDENNMRVTWTVLASDGILASNPVNGSGVFFLSLLTGIKDGSSKLLPAQFALHANYPNPLPASALNPVTILPYDLPQTAWVRIEIYDLLGKRVRTLIDQEQPSGFYQISWDGFDDNGAAVESGVYLYRLHAVSRQTKAFTSTRKMLLLR